jgi:hypothetical protein
MRDRHLGHVGSWRESEWEATFFKRLRLLGMQNGLTVRWDGDRTPIEFLEGIEHYQALMYDAYRSAAIAVASDVDDIEATAQAVWDATQGGAIPLTGSLEERRRRALDRAPSVITKAATHAAHLESIQRFGDSIFRRGADMLRSRRPFDAPAFNVPVIPIPAALYEIGQARVSKAFGTLTKFPLDEMTSLGRRSHRWPTDLSDTPRAS